MGNPFLVGEVNWSLKLDPKSLSLPGNVAYFPLLVWPSQKFHHACHFGHLL